MLTIRRDLYDAIVAHAREDHPREACGIIAGPAGSYRGGPHQPGRWIPMENADHSTTAYRFDTDEQLAVWREMDGFGEEPLVIYHSHTATEAYPSRTDVAHATEPDAHYAIVSTRDTDGLGDFQFRSFRILDGEITEEEVSVVPRSDTAAAT